MQDSNCYYLEGFQISLNLSTHALDILATNTATKTRYFKSIDDFTTALMTDNICLNAVAFYQAIVDGFTKKEICNQITISQNGKMKLFLRQHGKGQLVVNLELDRATPCNSVMDSDELNYSENMSLQNKLALFQNELYHIKHDIKQNLDDKFDMLDQRLRLLESKVVSLPSPNQNSIGSFSQISTDIYSPVLHRKRKISEVKIEEMSKHHENDTLVFNLDSFNAKYYKFSNSNKMATRTCWDKHWESVFCTTFFKEKYEVLHFKLVKSFSNYIMIGIAPDTYLHNKACFDKPGSLFFYCYNGTVYLDGLVQSTQSLGLKDGDILTIMLDLEDAVATFMVNYQIIFSDVFPGLTKSKVKYFPCIETFNIDDTISIVNHAGL